MTNLHIFGTGLQCHINWCIASLRLNNTTHFFFNFFFVIHFSVNIISTENCRNTPHLIALVAIWSLKFLNLDA